MKIKIKKLHESAIIPKYQTEGSAGFDLHSVEDGIIPSGKQILIPIGIAVEIPPGTELQIRPRSGLSLKHMISITNSPGTLDSDYRGPVGVILLNLGSEPFIYEKGDRIVAFLEREFGEIEPPYTEPSVTFNMRVIVERDFDKLIDDYKFIRMSKLFPVLERKDNEKRSL
jgi:dUTP pyrophosphatase